MLPVYGDGSSSTTNVAAGNSINFSVPRRRRRPERKINGHGLGRGLFMYLLAGVLVWTFGAIAFRGENVKTYGNGGVTNVPYRRHTITKDIQKFLTDKQPKEDILFTEKQQILQQIQKSEKEKEKKKLETQQQQTTNKITETIKLNDNDEIEKQINEYIHNNDDRTTTEHTKTNENINLEVIVNDDDDDDDNDDNDNDDNNDEIENVNANENVNDNDIINEDEYDDKENKERRQAILDAMKKAWGGYEKYAWGSDELRPISKRGHNWLGSGASIVDSLDTLWIMGMKDEFYRARDWIRDDLNFKVDMNISFFETTIRVLGGLLSAYSLSNDQVFLDRADELGKILLGACTESQIGIPLGQINPLTGATSGHKWSNKKSVLAEVGTVQIEFLYLSILTKNSEYAKHALKIYDIIFEKNPDAEGLYHVLIDPRTGVCNGRTITIGSLGDSFYEYLLKLWIFAGASNTPEADKYRKHYDLAMDSVESKLISKTSMSNLTYISEVKKGGTKKNAMDHLCCFAGGMLVLGTHKYGDTELPKSENHLKMGTEVTRTCHEFYARSPTGLSPESVEFDSNGREIVYRMKFNLIRPETVESYFYLWRKTHDKKYRDWGWEMFQAFKKYCEVDKGFTGIKDVTKVPPDQDDLQPSWFLAETIKYMYLLFSPDSTVSLDDYVFNTEAHPFPIQKQNIRQYFVY